MRDDERLRANDVRRPSEMPFGDDGEAGAVSPSGNHVDDGDALPHDPRCVRDSRSIHVAARSAPSVTARPVPPDLPADVRRLVEHARRDARPPRRARRPRCPAGPAPHHGDVAPVAGPSPASPTRPSLRPRHRRRRDVHPLRDGHETGAPMRHAVDRHATLVAGPHAAQRAHAARRSRIGERRGRQVRGVPPRRVDAGRDANRAAVRANRHRRGGATASRALNATPAATPRSGAYGRGIDRRLAARDEIGEQGGGA